MFPHFFPHWCLKIFLQTNRQSPIYLNMPPHLFRLPHARQQPAPTPTCHRPPSRRPGRTSSSFCTPSTPSPASSSSAEGALPLYADGMSNTQTRVDIQLSNASTRPKITQSNFTTTNFSNTFHHLGPLSGIVVSIVVFWPLGNKTKSEDPKKSLGDCRRGSNTRIT